MKILIEWPILSVLIFLPLVGALFILFIRGEESVAAANVRAEALWASLITFATSLLLWVKFDRTTADFQFTEHREWISEFGMSYSLGIDGISLLFVVLTTFLSLICILASWESIVIRVKEYMIAFLVMETMMIGVFCALDTFLFYIF